MDLQTAVIRLKKDALQPDQQIKAQMPVLCNGEPLNNGDVTSQNRDLFALKKEEVHTS